MRGVGVTTAAPAGATISSGRQMTQARALVPVGLPGKVVSGRLQRSREATTSVPSSRASRLCVRASSGTLGEERGEDQGNDSFEFKGRLEPMMAGPGSQLGGGGATLERSKLEFKQTVQQSSPKLADGGGGGGIGNFINMGGGGGGDDDDDDDFFGGGDEDGDGDGSSWFRSATAELFDMGAIRAVLSEWGYTVASLPTFFRASAELFFTGAFSSANMVRFLCRDNRPTLARWLYEHLPFEVSRGLVGRLMADPGLAAKVTMDMLVSGAIAMYWEARQRGESFSKEVDLAAINATTAALASGALVYLLAPARVGAVARAPWQEMLAALPNNVFEAGSNTRTFSVGSRAAGFLAKAAQLSALGAFFGGAQSLLGSAAVSLRQRSDPSFKPSVPVPELSRAVAGTGAFMGLSANIRYNLLAGLDRYMFERANVLACYVASTTIARTASSYIGQPSRLWFQGLPSALPPVIPGYVYMGHGKYRRERPAGSAKAAPAKASAKKVRKTKRKVVKPREEGATATARAAGGAPPSMAPVPAAV